LCQSELVDLMKRNGRYICRDCSAATTSNSGTNFQANLLHLQNMAAPNASFLNTTFAGGDAKDTVYGLTMCLADAEQADCTAYLTGVAAELSVTRCMSRRGGMVLW
jgi:hypothetical protein